MSLILDALRKIELERKAKRQGSVNLRAEVLNYQGVERKKRDLRLPLLAAATLIIAATALFLLLRSKTGPAEIAVTGTNASYQPPAPDNAAKSVPVTTSLTPSADLQKIPFLPEPKPLKKAGSIPRSAAPAIVDSGNLVVTGIAWQEERNMRRAVVNGALLGEGAEIQGARITEIRENRVRFSREGETFEVVYPAAGR